MKNFDKCVKRGIHADCGARPTCHYCGVELSTLCGKDGCVKKKEHEGLHRNRKDAMKERKKI